MQLERVTKHPGVLLKNVCVVGHEAGDELRRHGELWKGRKASLRQQRWRLERDDAGGMESTRRPLQ